MYVIYRVTIIKVTISKIDNFKTTRQNELIFQQNNREAMELCLAKEEKQFKNLPIDGAVRVMSGERLKMDLLNIEML